MVFYPHVRAFFVVLATRPVHFDILNWVIFYGEGLGASV